MPLPAEMLRALYDGAIAGADAGRATRETLARTPLPRESRCWIIAAGKAAHAMTDAACNALEAQGIAIAGGIVIGPESAAPAHPLLVSLRGDHPVPGEASFGAANALAALVRQVGADDEVLVLLSGGTSSLIGAPIEGVSTEEYRRLFEILLGSGVDISTMNAVRKRFSQWGAGRLAVALAPARIRCLLTSDVIGDDPAAIASAPCVPDQNAKADVFELVRRSELERVLPAGLRDRLDPAHPSALPETPKPNDDAFTQVSIEVILGNGRAVAGAAAMAHTLRIAPVSIVAEPLLDDAAFTAEQLVDALIRFREGGLQGSDDDARHACMIWGGETTVMLTSGATGTGGRCQELALAAARALHDAGERGRGVWLLAAGTDGRDGPTDAAGAIVDASTWDAIEAAGVNPGHALHTHDAYPALDGAGALLRTGSTGTNVGDIVIGIVERA